MKILAEVHSASEPPDDDEPTNHESPSLDDVLDYYLLSSEEAGTDTLAETIKSYPRYEHDLRELSAFRKLGETVSNPE